jgi:hypothetical protein
MQASISGADASLLGFQQISYKLDDLGLQRRGLGLPPGFGPQLFAAKGVTAGAAVPLNVRYGERIGGALRLPNSRQFTLAVRTCHGRGFRLLLLTGRITARD